MALEYQMTANGTGIPYSHYGIIGGYEFPRIIFLDLPGIRLQNSDDGNGGFVLVAGSTDIHKIDVGVSKIFEGIGVKYRIIGRKF